ncbi:glycosyltransferase family 2 protein [Cryobacterium algoricola]|uniref:Glycosyltransferase family 2 protein n=1 Tax=Cryobacterium algoricola TaxID=1259183 RepID=A0ABY2IF07_9MICO|nr:glycosyltransferase [Cryobacterium algoricola]TFB88265.1 glycosyltransferase family 2 protein [Cryobacterium algoricola]
MLDEYTDKTDTVAQSWHQFSRIHTTHANVGAARRTGVRHLLLTDDQVTPSTCIATTDADSVVPRNWITAHLTFAHNYFDLVLGTVHPDDVLSPPTHDH